MVDYTWVAWFEELATTIAGNDERYLAGKAKDVNWNGNDIPLLNHGDGNIDPMSFLYTLAQKKHREPVRDRLPQRPRGIRHRFCLPPNPANYPRTTGKSQRIVSQQR